MQQKQTHRLVYKLESKVLRKSNWNLTLPLDTALRVCPECIVALSSSQCLRWIDEINGQLDITEQVKSIQNKIRSIKRQPKSKENKTKITSFYNTLYSLQFQRDYVCVILENEKEYDKVNEGFTIDFGFINGQQCKIKYRRFQSTNGGVKKRTIVYINELLYPELKKRVDNGRNKQIEHVPAKLESYQGLICSGSIPLPPPRGIIVVKDCVTKFKEDVILIDDSGDGEPKLTYQKDYEIEHDDSDGFGLMLPSYSAKANYYLNGIDEPLSGMNTRYAFEKGMLFTFDFLDFAENVAGTYFVTDVWGTKRDVRDADIILTESMLKLWDSYTSWEDYYFNCEQNGYKFSVAKTTPEELENVRDTNYQFLQSYNFSDEEIELLCKSSAEEISDVINLDYRKSLAFLCGIGLNENNVFRDSTEDYIKALMIDKRVLEDSFIRKKICHMIKKRIEQCEKGAIRINANFAIISGDPFALAQSIFGLKVTGLLKAGEVYHKYWLDKGAKEIACFRAPMTCHNNIRRMSVTTSEKIDYWFKYINSALIYNAWDSACEAMNGADKDGDTNMCTDNPIIVKNTTNAPTIICLQRKAEKKIPLEQDIISANKLAFNDEIGTVTNHITSMIERQSIYPKDSLEYETLAYRIMCGQLFQQNTIDRIKGIIAKPMPSYWYSQRDCMTKESDTTEQIRHKEFNSKICADRKPYFMTYVYPRLKKENDSYIKNTRNNIEKRFNQYGVSDINDLRSYEPKTDDMKQFLEYYDMLLPVGYNPCVVNRISWYFENYFKNFMSGFSKKLRAQNNSDFDYTILKSGVVYSRVDYNKIYEIYKEYNMRVSSYQQKKRTEKVEKFDDYMQHNIFAKYFRDECFKICSNEEELCDIVLDICYKTEKSKQFAWDICSSVIVKNLLKNNGYKISYPELVKSNGQFTFSGNQFVMREKNILQEPDDTNLFERV